MSQALTPFTSGQDYFMGNYNVVKLSAGQWVSIKREGVVDVKDLVKFKDDDIKNVILNLRQPQDVWHPTQETLHSSAIILVKCRRKLV